MKERNDIKENKIIFRVIREICRRNKLKMLEMEHGNSRCRKLGNKARKFHLFILSFYLDVSRRSDASPIYLIRERYEIDAYERIQPVNRDASCFS